MVESEASASESAPLTQAPSPAASEPTHTMSLPLTATADTTQQAVATSTLYIILGRLKEYAGGVVKERKPWTEVLDRNSFSKPENFADATSRLRKNINYFKINYLLFIVGIFLIWMVMHPSSLLVLSALSLSWVYVFVIRTSPLSIGGRTFSDREKLVGMAAVSLIIVFVSSVGTVIFSALALSFVVIALHGSMRAPDDLFIDSAEGNQGFFAVFTAPATVTGVSNV